MHAGCQTDEGAIRQIMQRCGVTHRGGRNVAEGWEMGCLHPAPSPVAGLIPQEAADRGVVEALWRRPERQLAAEGLCVVGLDAHVADYGSGLVEVSLPGEALPPQHTFSRGDYVRLSPADVGPASHSGLDGVVADVGPEVIRLEVERSCLRDGGPFGDDDERADVHQGGTWRLDKGFSDVTYARLRGALEELAGAGGGAALSGALRFVVASHAVANTGQPLQLPPLPRPAAAAPPTVMAPLNDDQRAVLTAATASRITLLQGAPPSPLPLLDNTITCRSPFICRLGHSIL